MMIDDEYGDSSRSQAETLLRHVTEQLLASQSTFIIGQLQYIFTADPVSFSIANDVH